MNPVQTEQGLLLGVEQDGIFAHLAIPFAAPPVGELRWRPPAPPQPWTGVRDAAAYGNAAVQIANTGFDAGARQSEDCLYLNVWTPTLDPAAKQAVMVWIHGGGFLNGAASMPMYVGSELARRGVTVVSLNYRLGAFGFLAHHDAGANFAVQDWVAGLRWVAANVASFGGDPANVTIFGQSAGGAAVRALLSTPSARGLFHRGIIQSAGFENYAVVASPSYQRAATATLAVLDQLGCRDIAELRAVPTEQVRAASFACAGVFPPPGQVHTPANLVWYPVVDDAVIVDDFAGWPSNVPVMLGCTEDESRFFIKPNAVYAHPELRPQDVYTQPTLETMARVLGGDAADDILAHFAASGLTPYEALAQLCTSAVWHEPALATMTRFADLDRTAFHYRFTRKSPGAIQAGLLAFHSAEIAYLFGQVATAPGYEAVDQAVSQAIQHAWVEFARTGVPSHLDGSPWPAAARAAPAVTVIADSTLSGPASPSAITALIHATR
ncbi:MAG: carboxylesterase family protein [Actinomycetota bacterium]|nr:carboxylesterase family protein [Actinomycetota bacterium]